MWRYSLESSWRGGGVGGEEVEGRGGRGGGSVSLVVVDVGVAGNGVD